MFTTQFWLVVIGIAQLIGCSWIFSKFQKRSYKREIRSKHSYVLLAKLLAEEEKFGRNISKCNEDGTGEVYLGLPQGIVKVFSKGSDKNVLTFPTLQGDSVTEETYNNITPLGRKYLKEVLIGLNKGDGIQAKYAPKKVELAGIYGNYQGKQLENGEHELAEMSFVGIFPAKKPRYSLAVFINRPNEPTHGLKDFANSIVNKLVEWLSKH